MADLDVPALRRTARLLTGSPTAGTELLVRVLSRRPATQDAALAAVVRAHGGRWAGLTRGAGSIDAVVPADAWWVSPADIADARATAAVLTRLTPEQRAVLVLTHAEGLAPDVVEQLVPGAAAHLAAAETAVAPQLPGPAGLPARLDGLLALDAAPGDDDTLPLRVRALRSRRRRRWATAAAVAVALVAGTVWVPGDVDLRADPPVAPSSTTPVPSAEPGVGAGDVTFTPIRPPAPSTSLLLTLGTRGSLAGDQAYLDALLTAASPALVGSPVETRQVLFAGDVGNQRIALVVGQDAFGLLQAWSSGPAGTPAAELEQGGSGGYGEVMHSVAGIVGDPGLFIALVVPGDAVEVSPRVEIDVSGTAVREWQRVESADGVLVVPTGDRGTNARYRVLRGGAQIETGEAWDLSGGRLAFPTGPNPGPLRPGPGRDPVDAQAYAAALQELTWPSGIGVADLRVSVLWSGEVPSREGPVADVVVLAAVLPNGAVVTTTAWSVTTGGYGSAGGCGSSGHPAGSDPATLTVVARCDVWTNGDEPLSSLVVTAPVGTSSVSLGADDGGPSVPVRLARGWAVVREPDPGLTTVTAPAPGRVSSAGPGDLWDV